MTIPGDTTATVLDGLTPETRYQVSVFAAYGHGEGQPLVGEETTNGKLLKLLKLLHHDLILYFFPPLLTCNTPSLPILFLLLFL